MAIQSDPLDDYPICETGAPLLAVARPRNSY